MTMNRLRIFVFPILFLLVNVSTESSAAALKDGRYLYVAVPGIRNYLEYGGHGLLVFDMDREHKFVKRIPIGGLDEKGRPINIKGVCANGKTGRIYLTTLRTMMCLDMATEKLLWEKSYEGGCDRMAMAPDGSNIYLPSLEKEHWYVVNAVDGGIIAKIVPGSRSHNTIYGLNGKEVYLAGLGSRLLTVADIRTHTAARTVGPFSHSIRPFTVNGKQSLVFVNVNDLLGFEVGDLRSGKMLHRVEVKGWSKGKVKRHGCPSHGIGMTPDETEIWLSDGANQRMHVFDATMMPPKQIATIGLRDQPGWVTFSLDGKWAYPSSGEVVNVKTKRIEFKLTDETGREVGSEKMVEVQWKNDRPVRTGDQFGLGRVR